MLGYFDEHLLTDWSILMDLKSTLEICICDQFVIFSHHGFFAWGEGGHFTSNYFSNGMQKEKKVQLIR
jgi:hypothetical protein